jgi:NADPH:quinone reductase-like Zn-dependent oxidoreductase
VEGTGERVFFLLPGGGYAEKVAVPREMLMPIPKSLSFEEAAAIPEAWLTAYLNLFVEAGLGSEQGESALVHAAASGVGTAALQLLRRRGVRAAATTRTSSKLDALRSMGVALAIDTTREDFAAAVEAAWGKDAVDAILDPVGAPFLEGNLRILRRKGRLVLIASMAGPSAEIDLRVVLGKRLRIIGSTLRSRPLEEKAALTASFAKDVLPGFAAGSLVPVVDRTFPLSAAAEAHRRMVANENVGKLVLVTD